MEFKETVLTSSNEMLISNVESVKVSHWWLRQQFKELFIGTILFKYKQSIRLSICRYGCHLNWISFVDLSIRRFNYDLHVDLCKYKLNGLYPIVFNIAVGWNKNDMKWFVLAIRHSWMICLDQNRCLCFGFGGGECWSAQKILLFLGQAGTSSLTVWWSF